MAIAFFCTKCGNPLSATFVNQEVVCPKCGEANTAPTPPAAAGPAPASAGVSDTQIMAPAAAAPPPPTAPTPPPMPPAAHQAPSPTAAPPKRRGLGLTCCCGCGAALALLLIAGAAVAIAVVLPKMRAGQYVSSAYLAEKPVMDALSKYTNDPAWKTVKEHEFSTDNMGEARDALAALAKSSAESRHAIDAADKTLAGLKPPTDLTALHADITDLNKTVSAGLNDMEPQIDYLGFVVESLVSTAGTFRELENSSATNLDQAANLLSKCREAVKKVHDQIMVKSAPPGCEKLHKDTIRSLEEMSDACSSMAEALRARDYGRILALAKTFESNMTNAAKRFESAYGTWGTQSDKRTAEFGKKIDEKLNAITAKLEEAQAKYGGSGGKAAPPATDDKSNKADPAKAPAGKT